MTVIIDGKTLTIEDVIRVARNNEDVVIAEDAKRAIEKARAYVDEKLSEGAVIYGLTRYLRLWNTTLCRCIFYHLRLKRFYRHILPHYQ